MTLVGFDTSLPTTTVCVLRDDGQAFRTAPPPVERLLGPPAHSRELLPELERLLRESGTEWDAVSSIAVGVGPGTFTGLRIGVATARALAQTQGVGVRPVSSLAALAAGAAAGTRFGEPRTVMPLIDARRGQVFFAAYVANEERDSPQPVGDRDRAHRAPRAEALEQLREPAVMDAEAVLAAVRAIRPPPVVVGDWAIKSLHELEEAGAEVPPPESGLHGVDALYVCTLAMSVPPVAPDRVQPVYLRVPDVEAKQAAERQARGNAR